MLDLCESDDQTWVDKEMSVSEALQKMLPDLIMKAIKHKLDIIQEIIDGTAKIKGLSTVWYSHESGKKHVAQFKIIRIPRWNVSSFEVYFVEIKAEYDAVARFGINVRSNKLEVRYHKQRYSTNTQVLFQEMRARFSEVKNDREMEEWEETTKSFLAS